MKYSEQVQYYTAPGRVCLYGEHQDYLKLNVVPAAINLRTIIGIKDNGTQTTRVQALDMNSADEFPISENISLQHNEYDYLRAIVVVLFQEGLGDKLSGLDVTISSKVPIGSGLSSSAALLVAWTTALNHRFQLELSEEDIAILCYKAENQVLGINCGIMDQYSSSLGGIFGLDCNGPPYKITRYDQAFSGLVIGDSCVRRAANEPLTEMKNQLFSGIEKLQKISSFNIKDTQLKELNKFQEKLSVIEFKRLTGAITIRDITTHAQTILQSKDSWNLPLLGKLLTKQQDALRDLLEVSISELDNLITASLDAGAYGAKLTGAGYGGCMIAFAPGKEEEVAAAINTAGGKAIICQIDSEGGRKEK